MEETKEVRFTDLIKHYYSSAFIYTVIYIILLFCPLYYETVTNDFIDYSSVLGILLIAYILLAPIFLAIFRPKSVLESRSVTILKYIGRQFRKHENTEQFLKSIEPEYHEKQALTILFVQTFFGVYCVNTLCNNYIANFSYNIDFLKVMYEQAVIYANSGAGNLMGALQFLSDTADMWTKLLITVNILILTISYFSDTNLFKNKIKSVDTTPLGILTCIMCYYPMTILTNKLFQTTEEVMLPVNNLTLSLILNSLVILVHIGMLFALLRLGTKAGNLTNRGIVTGFPYNIIRHPDYTMQILYIIITTIPLYLSNNNGFFDYITVTVATMAWIYLYYLRAITEERHLINDPEYKEYTEKVKYRFIPKVF